MAGLMIVPSPPPDESFDSHFQKMWALATDSIHAVPWAGNRALLHAVSFSAHMVVRQASVAEHRG